MTAFLIIICFLSFQSLSNLKEQEIAEIESTLLQERRNQLRDVVQNAYSTIVSANFYETAQKAVSGMRFGENGKNFFYVLDSDGMFWVNPANPEWVGKSGQDLKDSLGNHYIMELIANALITSEGFVELNQAGTDGESLQSKLVHYKLIKKWNWIVCAEVFIDDIKTIVTRHQAAIQQSMTRQLTQFIISGSLALLLTVLLSMKFFYVRLVAPIHKIIHAVECMSIKKFNVDVSVHSNQEINQLADAVERMQNSFEVAFARLKAKGARADHRVLTVEPVGDFSYLRKAV
jgi:methyl-accepting chemotaxis protein